MNNKIEETIKRVQRVALDADIKIDDGSVRHFHRGHEYVEIGGMKWATMNIGANSVCDGGLYFAWGGTRGYTVEQVKNNERRFDWTSYEYCNESGRLFTKYSNTDGKTVLDLEDDAANVHWGGNWRMPTTVEFQALGNAVNEVWTTDYKGSGVNGLVCTDKTDPSKVLFFPAAGSTYDGSVDDVGDSGYYWSSSLSSGIVSCTYRLFFYSSHVDWDDYYYRFCGFQLRGVLG